MGIPGSAMAKPIEGKLIVAKSFDYSQLKPKVAERVKETADRVRDWLEKTAGQTVEIGAALLKVKDELLHGQFGPWLKAEFGWTERTARNLMAVAERFGSKSEIISEFQPTALYLLAAPSAPDRARQTAIDRAKAGEKITAAVAKDILADSKKKGAKSGLPASVNLRVQLAKVLKRIRRRWDPEKISDLARQLRKFADQLEGKRPRSGQTGKKM
jgi:hypothetical protein